MVKMNNHFSLFSLFTFFMLMTAIFRYR